MPSTSTYDHTAMTNFGNGAPDTTIVHGLYDGTAMNLWTDAVNMVETNADSLAAMAEKDVDWKDNLATSRKEMTEALGDVNPKRLNHTATKNVHDMDPTSDAKRVAMESAAQSLLNAKMSATKHTIAYNLMLKEYGVWKVSSQKAHDEWTNKVELWHFHDGEYMCDKSRMIDLAKSLTAAPATEPNLTTVDAIRVTPEFRLWEQACAEVAQGNIVGEVVEGGVVGPAGADGVAGVAGVDGVDGVDGPAGPAGPAGKVGCF